MATATIARPDVITASELDRLRTESPTTRILDVRTGGEFESVHVPGSYNIPLDTLSEHVADVAAVDHHVVLICQSGARAQQAHERLSAAGKQTLHILDGGIAAWEAHGGELVRHAEPRWALDRQVRLVAGSIALTGVVASTVVPGAKWLAGAVATGLTFSAVSNTCAMGTMLSKLPYNRTEPCNVSAVLAALETQDH